MICEKTKEWRSDLIKVVRGKRSKKRKAPKEELLFPVSVSRAHWGGNVAEVSRTWRGRGRAAASSPRLLEEVEVMHSNPQHEAELRKCWEETEPCRGWWDWMKARGQENNFSKSGDILLSSCQEVMKTSCIIIILTRKVWVKSISGLLEETDETELWFETWIIWFGLVWFVLVRSGLVCGPVWKVFTRVFHKKSTSF